MPAASIPSGLPIPIIINDQQNTPPEDVLVISISDIPSGPSEGQCKASEDIPGVMPISPSNSVVTRAPQLIVT